MFNFKKTAACFLLFLSACSTVLATRTYTLAIQDLGGRKAIVPIFVAEDTGVQIPIVPKNPAQTVVVPLNKEASWQVVVYDTDVHLLGDVTQLAELQNTSPQDQLDLLKEVFGDDVVFAFAPGFCDEYQRFFPHIGLPCCDSGLDLADIGKAKRDRARSHAVGGEDDLDDADQLAASTMRLALGAHGADEDSDSEYAPRLAHAGDAVAAPAPQLGARFLVGFYDEAMSSDADSEGNDGDDEALDLVGDDAAAALAPRPDRSAEMAEVD